MGHSLEDFQAFADQLEAELDKFDDFHPADQPHIKRFVMKHDGRLADSTLGEYLKNLRKTGEALGGPLVELTEDAFDELVYDLRHNPEYGRNGDGYADGTVRTRQFAVRRFLTFLDDRGDVPGLDWAADIDLLPPSKSKVKPEDMLTPEDIAALCEGANNLRDIALIEFLADTGARLSLVGSLRVGDVDLDGPRSTYTPNPNAAGLKGAAIREYPIIDSKAALRTYLRSTHPRPDQPDVACFHTVPGHGHDVEEGDGSTNPTNLRRQLKEAAATAGVEKPVNPHNFRHSAITRMRREGYDRGEIEARVHWTIDTDMWEVYEHVSAEEYNEAIWAKAGIIEREDGPERTRRPCGNCRFGPLAPHHEYCPNCGEPASPAARTAQREAEDAGLDDLSDPETGGETRPVVREVLDRLRNDPDWRVEPRAHEESPSSGPGSESV